MSFCHPLLFCSGCGHRLAEREADGLPHCQGCGRVHYLDPKVAAACLIMENRKVLMVQRSIEPVGRWTIPGGFVDRFEDPSAAAQREVREETGLEVVTGDLLGVFRAAQSPVLLLVYRAQITEQSAPPAALHECQQVGFFCRDTLPWEQLAFETTRMVLEQELR